MKSWLLPGEIMLRSTLMGAQIEVDDASGCPAATFELDMSCGTIALANASERASGSLDAAERSRLCRALFAALECAFCERSRSPAALRLRGAPLLDLAPDLASLGLAPDAKNPVIRERDLFSHRPGWMGTAVPAIAAEAGDGRAGLPVRPPMTSGPIYARHIPWLGQTLTFAIASMDDLPRLHGWLNDPLVDAFWREAGSIEQHAANLGRQRDDPHTIPIIGSLDGVAFGYFEIYWAPESIIGPYCETDPFDRGWHVLIGEKDYRDKPFITAWLPSLMHLIFLDEPRTMRVLGEPDNTHAQQLRNLQRSGFDHIATVDLPMKRAAIVALTRERFEACRLWHPADAEGLRCEPPIGPQ